MVVKKSTDAPHERREIEKSHSKTLLVAQEISFAKVLAGNDKKLRDRGVKRLRKWLSARSNKNCDLKEDDFMRLWRGLFYCMWMADKPLFQEELAETISSLVHCFQHQSPSIKFMEGFFRTMAQEWKGIDQHRLDKFLMFVRRFLRQCFVMVEQKEWSAEVAEEVTAVFQATLFPDTHSHGYSQPPIGLVMHFTEIFLEELAKVSKGDLDGNVLLCFLKPFAQHLASIKDARIRSHINQHIFIRLLAQSPAGLEYQDKFAAWRKLGFPGGNINVMERAEDEGTEEEEMEEDDEVMQNAINAQSALDPRAGRVDVELPLLNFEPEKIVKFLEEYRFKKYTSSKSRKALQDLINKFEKLDEGEYPLGIKEVPEMPSVNIDELTEEAAEDLLEYGDRLLQDEDDSEDEERVNDLKQNGDEPPKKLKVKEIKRKNLKSGIVSVKKKGHADKVKATDENVAEKSPTESKRRKKITGKADSGKKKDVATFEVAAKIGNTVPNKASPSGNKTTQESVVPETSSESSPATESSGTKMLLQHIAPHLTTSKKLKRRMSCDARLQGSVKEKEQIEESLCDSGKKTKKRKSCEWNEPLKEGEYEIFIPKEKILAQKKRLSDVLQTKDPVTTKIKNPFSSPTPGVKPSTPGSSAKKVNFVLQRNTAQATSDYFRTLRENPAIPFDAKKEPTRGVLKPSPYSSPVNPFYKRKLKI